MFYCPCPYICLNISKYIKSSSLFSTFKSTYLFSKYFKKNKPVTIICSGLEVGGSHPLVACEDTEAHRVHGRSRTEVQSEWPTCMYYRALPG